MRRVKIGMSSTAYIKTILASLAFLIALIWIFRGVLLISQYSVEMAYAYIALVFLANIVDLKLERGFFGLISSFASVMASFAIDVCIAFFIGGFLGLEQQFTNYTLTLFVAGIILFVASWMFGRLVPPRRPMIGREIASFGGGQMQLASNLRARTENLIGLPVTFGNRLFGCVAMNDVDFSVNTTLGAVKVPAKAPVLIISSKLQRKERVRDATGEEYAMAEKVYSRRREQLSGTSVKIPFINVETFEDFATEVDIGPMRIHDTEEGTTVDIPPFIHVVDEGGPRKGRVFITSGDRQRATIIFAKGAVKAIWNGWRLKTDGENYTIIRKGSSYAKDRGGSLVVGSPGYELTVSKDNVSVELPDMRLMATPSVLVLRSGDKAQRISDEKLARKLIDAMVEVARNQVSDLFSGAELDPADVYDEIDSLLKGVD